MNLSAGIVLVTAVPLALWGLLGQDDETSVPRSELDYAVKPLDIAAGLLTTLGVIALVLAVASAAVLVHAARRGTFDRRRWQVLSPLILAGLIVGWAYQAATMGVIGANIGFGIILVFGTPLVAGLLLVAVLRERELRRSAEAGRHPARLRSTLLAAAVAAAGGAASALIVDVGGPLGLLIEIAVTMVLGLIISPSGRSSSPRLSDQP